MRKLNYIFILLGLVLLTACPYKGDYFMVSGKLKGPEKALLGKWESKKGQIKIDFSGKFNRDSSFFASVNEKTAYCKIFDIDGTRILNFMDTRDQNGKVRYAKYEIKKGKKLTLSFMEENEVDLEFKHPNEFKEFFTKNLNNSKLWSYQVKLKKIK